MCSLSITNHHSADENKKGKVLAVEDDFTTLAILSGFLESLDYTVLEAENGHSALSILERESDTIDVIIMDKTMPEMSGLEVVKRLKDDPKTHHIPVVMVTGSTDIEEVKEGIDAGVFYYLTKPYEESVFKSVLSSAMRESSRRHDLKQELQKHWMGFGFIDRAEFTISKMHEAQGLACFLANCFPDPQNVLPGLAGLLANAVEHGNLGIGYAEKTRLIENDAWEDELHKREDDPNYRDRYVRINLEKNEDRTAVTITDQGDGFEWTKFMDVDPARALDTHGRGIAQANKVSFDEIIYNDKGNSVTAIARNSGGIEW